jgi:hypothetical protein
MLPLTVGFLSAAVSGRLSDRYGARLFATGGMLLGALSFVLLTLLPANFSYPVFALLLLLLGISMGLFAAPNTSSIMSSVPADQRGAASGMSATFRNTGMVLSIGVFFSLMVLGLASALPHTMYAGLTANGVSSADATRLAHLPPVGTLFAAFLGYNPIATLLGPHVLAGLSPSHAAYLTGRSFFPGLISSAFMDGLRITFAASTILFLVAALASWMRGGTYDARGERRAEGGDAVAAEVTGAPELRPPETRVSA